MRIRALRFTALVLAALAMTMESAHVLELPQKLQYDPALYTAVNGTLYRWFAMIGAPLQISSIVAAGLLAFLVRYHRACVRWSVLGALCLLLAFGVWLAVVAPVNYMIAQAASTPESVPNLWMTLRTRWEYGHAAGFVLQLIGFCALLASVLVETPTRVVTKPQHEALRRFSEAHPVS